MNSSSESIDRDTGEVSETGPTHLPARGLNPFGEVRAASNNAMVEATASREVAEVQAAMVIAQKFPRNQMEAMDRILMAFTRPGLAEAALYSYARGGQEITGLSIRAAEAMAQQWGHIQTGVRELDVRNGVSTVEAYCFDAQTGTRDSRVFQVRHWRDTKGGGYALKDQRDIYELVANQASRRKRAAILAVIPGDVQEACTRQIEVTLRAKVEITPELLKSLEAKFSEFGVTVAAIEKRIQRRMEAITPALVLNLGKIYNSLRDGMSAPGDWFELETPPATDGEATEPKTGAGALRARAARAGSGKTPPAATVAPGPIAATGGAGGGGAAPGGGDLLGDAPPQPSIDKLVERMRATTNREALDVVAAEGDALTSADDRETVRKVYDEQRARLRNA